MNETEKVLIYVAHIIIYYGMNETYFIFYYLEDIYMLEKLNLCRYDSFIYLAK